MITVIETPAAQGLRGMKGDAGEMPTLPSGTPTNVAVAENDQLTDALWKLQGQTNAMREISFIELPSDTPYTYTLTAEETAARIIVLTGGSGDVVLTSTSSAETSGVCIVSTAFATADSITIDGQKVNPKYNGFEYLINNGTGVITVGTSAPTPNTVVEMPDAAYNVNDLQSNIYYVFTNASAVTLTVQPNATAAIPDNAEYQIERRGAGNLTIVAGSGVTILPPKGGSLILEDGDFVVLKRTAVDTYKLHGTTQSA